MTSWIPYVFVRVVIFFIGGITLGIYYPDSIRTDVAAALSAMLALAYVALVIIQRVSGLKIPLAGFLGLATIFVCGFVCLLDNNQLQKPDHIASRADVASYRAVITTHPQERERSWKFEAEIDCMYTDMWQSTQGKIMMYLAKDSLACPYDYGDVIVVKGAPQFVQPPGNPGEFDYQKYLSYKNIFHQHFVRPNEIFKIHHAPPWKFMELAIKARVWADGTLKKFIRGEREQATISALVLGVTDGLDNELLNAYAGTGAMHVLAVSGLHISIVYLLISFLLSPLKKVKHGKAMLALISIMILWSYSFITGLSPSVLRAVVMFTFMALARASDRQTNIYNTLALAAFCLLLYDPYLIMSVGFQLSFFAVLGILYFHPFIYSWWQPGSWIVNEIWTITSVSIAAQVSTFPLGLLYFHQFPNYFLLANLFVIPGSFIVLLGGILLLVVSIIPVIADVIGLILTWVIKFLNGIVFFFESLPYSLIENIHISLLQCYLLATIIVFITLLCVKRRLVYLKVAIIVSVLFAAGQWLWLSRMHDETRIIVYKVQGHHALDVIEGGIAWFASDSILHQDLQKQKFHIRPNRIIHAVDEVVPLDSRFQTDGMDIIVWRGLQLVNIKKKGCLIPTGIIPHIVIVSNNAFDRSTLPVDIQNVVIVLDSSNSFYFADKVIRDKANEGLNIYSVLHRGAFEMTLNTSRYAVRNL